MITPQRMSEFEKNKIIDMFSKLNQDLTSLIIKKLQQNEDISSFTKAQMRVLARQGGKEIFNEALNKANGLSRERKKQLLQLFNEIQNEQMKGYKETYEAKGLEYEIRQKQTYYARQVRDKKEQVAILSKSDKRNNATNEELIKAKKDLRNAQMKFRQYSKSNGIDVDYELTWQNGYNK